MRTRTFAVKQSHKPMMPVQLIRVCHTVISLVSMISLRDGVPVSFSRCNVLATRINCRRQLWRRMKTAFQPSHGP